MAYGSTIFVSINAAGVVTRKVLSFSQLRHVGHLLSQLGGIGKFL